MVIQAGDAEPWPIDPLAKRLDAAYYALTRTTHRHFAHHHEGWFCTGVDGLDAPTMNRAAVETAPPDDVARVIDGGARFFQDRATSWSVVLASFRDTQRWHSELVSRGFHVTATLDVLAREPGPWKGHVPDVKVREARADEIGLFTELLMEVFRMPRRFHAALLDMTDAWRRAGAKLYFGLDEAGQPASTTLVSSTDGIAGIYNVGTLRRERRRGHAAALMARALEDAKGADVVTLQVAPEGFVESFYIDLGFSPVYHWTFYQPRMRIPFFGR